MFFLPLNSGSKPNSNIGAINPSVTTFAFDDFNISAIILAKYSY